MLFQEPKMSKGGQNPSYAGDQRPSPPQGSSNLKGVTVMETQPVQYERIQKFYSDEEIEELFGDSSDSIVMPLLRRAQKAENILEKILDIIQD